MPSSAAALIERLRSYEHVEIGEARALPMSMYRSQPLFDAEMEAIFRREWICVGREEQVREPGDFFTREICGEPIVVVRGRDGELRALSAVCRHRYFSVVEGTGNALRFTCPYHLWTYELDGRLRGAPHMDRVCDARGDPVRLPQFALTTWLGFVFVSLHPNPPPLAPKLADAEPHWANYDIGTWVVSAWVDEVWPGNWKLAMETALEGYHVTGLHPGTIDRFMPSGTSSFEATSKQWTLFRLGTVYRDDFALFAHWAERMPGKDRDTAPQFGFFPNTAVSCSQFSSIWLTFLPLDVGSTRVIGGALVPPDYQAELLATAGAAQANAEAVNAINAQDASGMVNLQRNAGSHYAEPGLLSDREACLLYFYRYLAGRLSND